MLRGKGCELEVSDAEVLKADESHFVIIAARQGYLLMFYRQGQENCCVNVTFRDTKEAPSSARGYETSQACFTFMGVGLDMFPRSTYISSVSRNVFIY